MASDNRSLMMTKLTLYSTVILLLMASFCNLAHDGLLFAFIHTVHLRLFLLALLTGRI